MNDFNHDPYRKSIRSFINFIDVPVFPTEIINAQIEEAFALSCYTEQQSSSAETREQLQNQGVKSFRISKLSETYDLGRARTSALSYFVSTKAKNLLQRFIVRSAPL